MLFYYNDLKISEIAEILEIPEGTVKSRLNNAKAKLYEELINGMNKIRDVKISRKM